MMPSEIRHQKISIFADLETLKKDERARRRILRIQQVRQQSKLLASQVIARTRTLREKEENHLRQRKEQKLKEWKHQRLSSLRDELNYGLEVMGESYKAVDKELAELSEKQLKREQSQKLAQERGLKAAQGIQRDLEEDKLREERRRHDREELRILENIRAKAIATLPPSPSKSSSTQVPELKLRTSSDSSALKTTATLSTDRDSGSKVEVYNYSQPQQQQQFRTLPDNIVEKLTPSTCKVSAREQAERELQDLAEQAKERAKKEALSSWLGTAAGARQILEKEYASLVQRLPLLSQQEARTNPEAAVTLSDIARAEEKKKATVLSRQDGVPHLLPAVIAMEPHSNGQDAQPRIDFTDFPATQFTEEEAGALGATASSLQVLLDGLAGESRRRLQEVLDEDDFDYFDEDFDEPAESPRDTPPPPQQQQQQQLESSTKVVTLDVKTKHKVTVQGSPPSSPSTITSKAEVSVTVTSKSKSKRRKKKSKSKTIPTDELEDSIDNIKLNEVQQAKQSKKKTKSKTSNLVSSKPTSEQIKSQTVSGELQKNVSLVSKTKPGVSTEDNATLTKQNVVKSVEIDKNGVAYIRKAGQMSPGDNIDPLGAVKRNDDQTNYSEEIQYKNNKQSFVSNSTQYHSPPEDMLGDENIDKYLKSIEREKKQVGAYLESKKNKPQIDLPQYIDKLLTMTRDSVDQLSVSDVTESSSEQVLGRRKKKKKSKSKSSPSTSTDTAGSQSTEDSHLTLSQPSPGIPNAPMIDSASVSTVQLSSSSSLDSKLKFSDSSSNKESDSTVAKSTVDRSEPGARLSPMELDSTAYLTLHDLSSKVPGKANLDPPKTSTVNIFVDLPKLPSLPSSNSADYTDIIIRPLENLRLSTIIEADSSVAADDENVTGNSPINDSSSSMLDVEAELRRRGLPVLTLPQCREPSPSHTTSDSLLSPELERKLREMKVAPWSSNMMRRMKQADSLSSSSDEQPPRLSDSSSSATRLPCHSTPVSMERVTAAELTQGSERFFLHDSVVSPITPSDEKASRSLSS